jgi:hypothetical protein
LAVLAIIGQILQHAWKKSTEVVASHAQLKNGKTLPKSASYECPQSVTSSRNTALNLENIKEEVSEQQIGFVRSRQRREIGCFIINYII